MTSRFWSPLGFLAAFGLAACTSPTPEQPAADAIYHGGRIYTVESTNPWAEALAIKDGRLVAVGDDDDVMRLSAADTEVIDLGGKMVMPGIQDTHNHPSDAGATQLYECKFRSSDIDVVREALTRCLEDVPEGAWLRGGQWDRNLFSEDLLPKRLLDSIAPDNPVFLMDWSVHNAWINSNALERLRIDADTPDPNGGVIVRDAETGEATGILLDNAAYNYRRDLPPYSAAERADALLWSIAQMAQHGVTSFREALTTTDFMRAYEQLAGDGRLPLRAGTSLTWKSAWANSHQEEQELIARRRDLARYGLGTAFAKIMLDGIPPTYTAAMLEPYLPNSTVGADHRGTLMLDPAELAEDVTYLDAQGIAVKIHATGDRSLRVALDAIEAARIANGDSGVIHEVSHAEMIHRDDLPRFAALNVAAEMCPILWYPVPGVDWAALVGPDRARVWPIRSLLESGALVTYGSDWPVVPSANPWPGIEAMVTRADPIADGDVQDWPEQAIDLASAIRIFTLNGAIVNQREDRSGSLAVGKDADFIVLDRNLFEIPITEVSETQVELSIVDGKVVFER